MAPGEYSESARAEKQRLAAGVAAALVIVLAHFLFLMKYYEPAICMKDAHGYYAQARELAEHGTGMVTLESRVQYVGPGWKEVSPGRFVSMWPPGFPLVLAAVRKVAGAGAVYLVNPLMASLALLAVFLVCREWLGAGWGLAAACVLGSTPFLNEHAFFGYSHIAVLFFMVWGLYFTQKWVRTQGASWAVAAGLCAGFLPCVRYPAVLFGLAFAVYGALNLWRGGRRAWISLAAFAASALLPLLLLGLYNQRLYGAFWTTGYSLIGFTSGAMFRWDALKGGAPFYVQQLLALGGGPAFAAGLAGIVYVCARRDAWKYGVLLALLALPVSVLYMAYPQPPHAQSMRFLLPTFPVYALASVWLLHGASQGRARTGAALGAALVLCSAAWGLPLSVHKMQALEARQGVLADVTREVRAGVPRGSVIIADGLGCFNLDAYGGWRVACSSALLYGRDKFYDNKTGAALFQAFLDDAQAWAGPGESIYWIGSERRQHIFLDSARGRYTLEPLGQVALRAGVEGLVERPGVPGELDFRDPRIYLQNYYVVPSPEIGVDSAFLQFTMMPPLKLYRLTPEQGPDAGQGAER